MDLLELTEELFQASPEQREQLEIALAARRQGGVIVVGGRPWIHGVPAIAGDDPLIDVLSSWQCPHCQAALSSDGFICLNGCHLTQPQYQHMQAGLAEAQFVVERGRGIMSSLLYHPDHRHVKASGKPGPYAVGNIPPDFNHYRSLIVEPVAPRFAEELGDLLVYQLSQWLIQQQFHSLFALGDRVHGFDTRVSVTYNGVFVDSRDAMMFRLAWGGE